MQATAILPWTRAKQKKTTRFTFAPIPTEATGSPISRSPTAAAMSSLFPTSAGTSIPLPCPLPRSPSRLPSPPNGSPSQGSWVSLKITPQISPSPMSPWAPGTTRQWNSSMTTATWTASAPRALTPTAPCPAACWPRCSTMWRRNSATSPQSSPMCPTAPGMPTR